LKTVIHIRFGPTVFEDHYRDLTKLQQTEEYQLQFEQVLSRVGNLFVPHQLGHFVSGLNVSLRTEVQEVRPATITEAIGLARLYEACHQGTQTIFGMYIKEPEPPPLPSSSLTCAQELVPVVKRLSLAELQERRDRCLCFNWDERFILGHQLLQEAILS
jgi:hypothetical protein